MIEIKTIKKEGIPAALEMAKRYRFLGEPEEAESICLDILAARPGHQDTMITLVLALTDRFAISGLNSSFEKAKQAVEKLDSAYCKFYYTGIIYEKRAKYHLKQGGPGSGQVAYSWFLDAMQAFGDALNHCDPNNQDAVLRWNACARYINSHPEVKSDDAGSAEMLLDPYETPH